MNQSDLFKDFKLKRNRGGVGDIEVQLYISASTNHTLISPRLHLVSSDSDHRSLSVQLLPQNSSRPHFPDSQSKSRDTSDRKGILQDLL